MLKDNKFSSQNFPVKTGTKQLEIVITWEDEPNKVKNDQETSGRKYKEEIVITK